MLYFTLSFRVIIAGSQCFGLLRHSWAVHLTGNSRHCFQMAIEVRAQCDFNGYKKEKSARILRLKRLFLVVPWFPNDIYEELDSHKVDRSKLWNKACQLCAVRIIVQCRCALSWIICTFGLSLHRFPVPFASGPVSALHFCWVWTEFIVNGTNECSLGNEHSRPFDGSFVK